MAKVVFKYGSRAEYDSIAVKDANQLYFIEDTGEIYKGNVALARGNHYEGVRGDKETDTEVIARVLANNIALKDDIFVIKTLIADDKYSYTSFIFDGSDWKAMDGNYNAENVYFDQDLIFTKEVGYAKLTNGSATVPANGKNVKEVFEYLFSKEENPVIKKPTITISMPQAKAYEVGEKVVPTYTTSFNAGSYSYGPTTDVTATSYSVTDGINTLTTATGTMPELTVEDGTSYRLSVSAVYSDGAIPLSNLGNEKADLAITSGTATANSGSITGYRNMFVGADAGDGEITSAVVRALSNKRQGASATITYAASTVAGAKRVIVAIPTAVNKTVKSVLLTSSMNANITTEFKQIANVNVEGANGATAVPYAVYVYQPASLDSAETYSITIG